MVGNEEELGGSRSPMRSLSVSARTREPLTFLLLSSMLEMGARRSYGVKIFRLGVILEADFRKR